jgi:NIPSNAP protein
MTLRPILFIAALGLTLIASITPAAAADDGRQYYELRVYHTKSEDQQKRVNDYWQNAGVPAYNRLGIQTIGVFTETEDSPTNNIYVLLPSNSFEAFEKIPAQLAADAVYQKAAADFLNAPKSNAAYERFESSLLVAFDSMKHLTLPPADKKPNIFELRNYISSSEAVGLNKIKMFESGEIGVMKDVGLAPIFYSRMLVGSKMPSLVYMTCGENADEHKKHWQAFSAAKVWKDLQADPQYKDNVSTIIRIMLKRTSASQI